MKTAIILHGMPGQEEYAAGGLQSERHWIPWLREELIKNGIPTETPELPDASTPNYDKWRETFEWLNLDSETFLIGHSCGGGFLVRWLSEHEIKVGKVILVAPWMDPDRDAVEKTGGFFNFDIDPGLVERTDGVTIFYSTDDDGDIRDTVRLLTSSVAGIQARKFEDKGHFTREDMGTDQFPELLEAVL